MASCPKDWIDIISTFSIFIIAVMTVCIAWQQWRTAELKRRNELFDKRYEFYEIVRKFIHEACSFSAGVSKETSEAFFNQMHKGYFLFGTDIKEYLRQLQEKWFELNVKNGCIASCAAEDKLTFNSEKNIITDFFKVEKSRGVEEKFSKYLSLDELSYNISGNLKIKLLLVYKYSKKELVRIIHFTQDKVRNTK